MRALVPIVCNQLVTLLVGILSVKLTSKFIPLAVNGNYGMFLTLTQLGMLLTHSGIANHATRYWQREGASTGTYARFLWRISWRQSIYLVPLLLVISGAVSFHERNRAWLWVFPFLLFSNVAMALNVVGTGVLNADRKPWPVLVLNVIGSTARVLLPIGVALVTTMSFFMLSAGFALHGVVVVLCLIFLFREIARAPRPSIDANYRWMRELREYGLPFMWMGVGAWLLQNADRWIVKQFYGDEQAGLFYYASTIGAMIPTLIVGGLMQLVFPSVFRKADLAKTQNDWQGIARQCDQVTVLFLALSILGLWSAKIILPYLVGPLIGERYVPALPMLLAAGFAMTTVQVNQFYYLLLQGQHNSVAMVKVMIVVAGVKTIGSVVAAAVSWQAFQGWLIASLLVTGLAGRYLIRTMALNNKARSDRAPEP